MSPPVSQATEVFSPAAAEEAVEEEKETANLSSVLEQLGLSEYLSTFEQEKIDVESLVRTSFFFYLSVYSSAKPVYGVILSLSVAYVHSG